MTAIYLGARALHQNGADKDTGQTQLRSGVKEDLPGGVEYK